MPTRRSTTTLPTRFAPQLAALVKTAPEGTTGCTRSSSTAIASGRASSTASRSSCRAPATTGRRASPGARRGRAGLPCAGASRRRGRGGPRTAAPASSPEVALGQRHRRPRCTSSSISCTSTARTWRGAARGTEGAAREAAAVAAEGLVAALLAHVVGGGKRFLAAACGAGSKASSRSGATGRTIPGSAGDGRRAKVPAAPADGDQWLHRAIRRHEERSRRCFWASTTATGRCASRARSGPGSRGGAPASSASGSTACGTREDAARRSAPEARR